MNLLHILVFIPLALVIGAWSRREWRKAGMLISSLVALYWLQPASPIRNLDFWLPTASLSLTLMTWVVTQKQSNSNWVNARIPALIILLTFFAIGLTRYMGNWCCLTPTRPPELWKLALSACILGSLLSLFKASQSISRLCIAINGLCILGFFIILKSESLNLKASMVLRSWSGQASENASLLDIPWLGFSYLAFRLLHVLQDFRQGRLPAYTLHDFVVYALFFPSLTAGPIDRSQRFIQELNEEGLNLSIDVQAGQAFGLKGKIHNSPLHQSASRLEKGGRRLIIGLFKKFALADTLALIALNAQIATQVNSTIWAWVILYAYALRIYFDFSGYTDLAIGLGTLMGITLPENFDKPYRRINLTAFWNSWHITLAQWFRAYFFNPLSRALRSRFSLIPAWIIIFTAQLSTMVLIGLWHGISWNFTIWGIWHGLGLFIHNRWLNLVRILGWEKKFPRGADGVTKFLGWFLTFNYITLGWVWFVLSEPAEAMRYFTLLFGSR